MIRIVKCLCGPARHLMMVLMYEPTPEGLNTSNSIETLKLMVTGEVKMKRLPEACRICGRREWLYEDDVTAFRDMQEATLAAAALKRANDRAMALQKAAQN